MEIQPVPPDEGLSMVENFETSETIASRKRQRQNLQDVSNTKSLTAPLRASGRIRIKMTAAAEQKLPEPASRPTKIINNNINNAKQRRKPKKLKSDLVSELAIDVKRPSSVLVDTSIRALLTNVAFAQLSPENQKILVESLPLVDRPCVPTKEYHNVELNPSSINNEFFNRACIEWRDRLSNGEFTNEHQTKLRAEHEREKSKIDPWKARNFEGIWGIKSNGLLNVGAIMEKSAMEMKQRVEQGDFEIPEGFIDEVWDRKEHEDIDEYKMDTNEESWEMIESPSSSPSQNPSVSTSAPTPPDVSSTQQEFAISPQDSPEESLPAVEMAETKVSQSMSDQPVIAEATSSADDAEVVETKSQEPSRVNYGDEEVDYSENMAGQEELPSEEVPTRWYHQDEHDYLKNVVEPEPSGLDNIDERFENEIVETEVEEPAESSFEANNESDEQMTSHDNISRMTFGDGSSEGSSRIHNYDAELPQDIFQKHEMPSSPFPATSSGMMTNSYVHRQETSPVYVRQVIDPSAGRFKGTVIIQDDPQQQTSFNHVADSYVMEEPEQEDLNCYKDGLQMNLTKNVKLLTLPPSVKYNEKFIIEEAPQHLQQHQTQHIHQQPSNMRPNGTAHSSQYFVSGTNFAYISKVGNKIEAAEAPRIIKQEPNNNLGQIKQRIIYEIAREPSTTHHVAYATQPHQEVFHQMVKHPNGTTTIYETTAPPAKKTIIQRKKPIDPYTVQVMANNNTIILTPIGSGTQQLMQQQPQKSIVHIHRAAPMMQQAAPPVQFLAAPHTFLKKQTIIHPQMTQKTQTNYTTVIRTPTMISPQQQQQQQQQQQIITTVSSKPSRPIQKQKVIMSTSSLQQYRSYNQKAGHGSRKQLHPQHIIRPAPSPNNTTVIHQQIKQEQTPLQMPHQISTVIHPTSVNEQVIMTSAPMTINSTQIHNSPVVIGTPPPGINNIYVRPKRPQQIFQPSQPPPPPLQQQQQQHIGVPHQQQQHIGVPHQHLGNISNINSMAMMTTSNVHNLNNQQMLAAPPPRMRHQQINQRPPPGSVNLERSYQICQAVIQNSANPNRQQLNNQLKPPPHSVMTQKKF